MELLQNLNIENIKNNFLESTLGQVINNAIETGLRMVLPDFIEDDVIGVKNTLINDGLPEAVKEAVNKSVNLGKAAIGAITGNFESVEQAEKVIEKGGLLDGVSDALDYVLNKVKKSGKVSKDVVSFIKKGKDTIIKNVSSDIKSEFKVQNDKIEKLDNYNKKWKEAFDNKDFKSMETNMKKINEILKSVLPVESIINNSRTIENLHNLIKNNGQNFELNEEQKELAKILS